jgi:hypothetical protein
MNEAVLQAIEEHALTEEAVEHVIVFGTRRRRELEARRAAINAELSNLQPIPRLPKNVVQDRLAEWRRLLRHSTTQGRAVLQRVLNGRIVFTPDGTGGYTFEAPTRFDKLFTGIVVECPTSFRTANAGGNTSDLTIHSTGITDGF